jgi:hypothetical protein
MDDWGEVDPKQYQHLKGKWFVPCCQEDYHQILDDDDIRSAAFFNHFPQVYDTKEEAQAEIIDMWMRSGYQDTAEKVKKQFESGEL